MVIGSGATAVTLVPALAEQAAHVTMLQRSPSYILAIPSQDAIANVLRRLLGDRRAYAITRWKNVAVTTLIYQLSQRRPRFMKRLLRAGVARAAAGRLRRRHPLQPALRPVGPAPVPGARRRPVQGDPRGPASMVTDTIERFTPHGIQLASGAELEADIIVTATGLNLLALGGIELVVDGEPVAPARAAWPTRA